MRPDWRAPAGADLSSEWKDMQVPGNWESRGLPDFDGVVWFTRTLDWTDDRRAEQPLARAGSEHRRGLGQRPVADARAVCDAGRGAAPADAARGAATTPAHRPADEGPRRRHSPCRRARFAPGKNTITVRIQNTRNDGGFIGTPETMFIQAGESRTPLAGTWKYRVERQTNAGAFYTKPGQLAAHVAFTGEGGLAGAAGAALPPVAPQAPDVVLRLSVIPNQMKFDVERAHRRGRAARRGRSSRTPTSCSTTSCSARPDR